MPQSSEPRRPSPVLPVAVTLAVLVGLYVGAYYWAVIPEALHPSDPLPLYALSKDNWKVNDAIWVPFFAPIHWLDRRIRPHVWEPSP